VEEMTGVNRVLVKQPEGQPRGIPSRRRKGNIKIQHLNKWNWRALTVMNRLRIGKSSSCERGSDAGNFLTSSATVSFSRITVFCGLY
jgi:hypothetical protein